jgi:malate dehydrogenase (oxaloacetate-decarboxylating)(NADP+)
VGKIQNAVRIIKEREPELMVDGEMNADVASDKKLLKENYPFSTLEGPANVLIFPDLHSGNIAYKLLGALAEVEMIGPVLMGMDKPVHLLQIGSSTVKDVVNMTAYAAVDAQMRR